MDKIDFVVTWVNGNDPKWQEERAKYAPADDKMATASSRFRDWGLMKYWFRGVEKYAPWVNKVYFVTWGHYPEWLDLDHPKLVVVNHTDYIPAENLPTFNSNVIELYLNRLEMLSEQFVLFNDDMFLIDAVKPTDFFKKGLPCETVRLGSVYSVNPENVFPHTILNNTAVINKHFSKPRVMKKYWKKFLSLKYGTTLARNALLMPFKYFSSFYDTHLPTSHLKSTFDELWEKESKLLTECGTHRFRSAGDITHWLMKNWRACQGRFVPRSIKWGQFFSIGSNTAVEAVEKQNYKAVCLNDTVTNMDFDAVQRKVIAAFERILPEASSFEKQG